MADPLSMLAGITGVLAFTAKLTREVIALASEIRDAPEDITDLRLELQHLSSLIQSTDDLSTKYPLRPDCKPLGDTVIECLERCRTVMEAIKLQLRKFVSSGIARRSPMRMISWTMRKDKIQNLRSKLRDSKAMLELSITVFNSHLTGKGQQDIKDEVARGFEKLARQFQSAEKARKFRSRLQDDLESVSAFGGRRTSFSNTTDAGLPMKKFLEGHSTTSLVFPIMDEMHALPDSGTLSTSGLSDHSPSSNDSTPQPAPEQVLAEAASLLRAAQAGNSQQVRALIALGASPSTRSGDGRTALHFCAIYDDVATAEILVEHGADVNAKDTRTRSPLRIALSTGSLNIATFLLERGATLDNFPALPDAIRSGQEVEGLKSFLGQLRARLGTADGYALLHEVLERDDDIVLRLLLEARFDPHAPDASGITLIHHAILRRRKSSLSLLLQYGANPDDYLPPATRKVLRDDVDWHRPLYTMLHDGITPLATAGRAMNDPSITRLLLEAGADPNWEYPTGLIALTGMCASQYLKSAKLMIDFGANVNKKDRGEYAPLFWAIVCDNVELLHYMVSHGADLTLVSAKPHPHWTPLHLAIGQRNGPAARLLIEAGADVNAKDEHGRRPIELVDVYGDCNVKALLEEKMKA